MPSPLKKTDRRTALKAMAAGSCGYILAPQDAVASRSANEKLNIAVIGIGGRGAANLSGVSGENIIALCDVDEVRGAGGFKRFPKAQKFRDYRRMFDAIENSIDAVVISTPDHTHFHPSMRALQAGKHLYCEKPMAHDINEVRQMTLAAKEHGVATQLGVQRHTIGNVHRVVELIKAGAIGKVSEVHSWVGGNRGMPKIPTDKPKVPASLDWDLWVGPAKYRDYHPSIAPYGWRFWWDYGTGETGNWGCHILDIPFWALDLDYPDKVEASGPPVHDLTTPKSLSSKLEFPAKGNRGRVALHWYHAKSGPEILKKYKMKASGNNTLFIGDKGMLLCGFGSRRLYPEEQFKDYQAPEKSIPDSPGFYKEWIEACKGGESATCNFDYSGPMTETVLLANLAYRSGEGFKWDAKKLRTVGSAKSQSLVTTQYRKGWEI